MAMRNAVGDRITSYCVLDSDYHTASEIQTRYEDAKQRGVNLHIWRRKEIENFLLEPRAIRRVLASRVKNGEIPSELELQDKILEICEAERDAVEDGFASALVQENRKLDLITANKSARKLVDEIWRIEGNRPMLVAGKTVLAKLSEWSQEEFGTAFGPPAIARQMTAADIPSELAEVIRAIEENSDFISHEEREAILDLRRSSAEFGSVNRGGAR
jgi:hypothetical protein